MDVFHLIPQFALCLLLTVIVVHRPAEVRTGRSMYKNSYWVYRTLASTLKYLYSTPARPVYTIAGREYWLLGRTAQNNCLFGGFRGLLNNEDGNYILEGLCSNETMQ